MYAPDSGDRHSRAREGDTRQFWNMNPPHFHLLVLPLAMLPPRQALASGGD